MAPETLSFRISRNTEDLAQTIHSLSQRLVKLEQRLAAMELQLEGQQREAVAVDPQQVSCLDNVERLLADCRELLALDALAEEAMGQDEGSESAAVSSVFPLTEQAA